MHSINLLLGVATLTLLAACEAPNELYLYKTGETVARADKDVFDCKLAAAQAVPTQTQIGTTPTYTTPVQTQCYNSGYSVQCTTTGGQTMGGQTYSYDANEDLRTSYLARCLASKGYSAADLPACDTKKVPASTLDLLRGEQRAPAEGACYVGLTDEVGNVVYASEIAE